jgi:hypothetical protein
MRRRQLRQQAKAEEVPEDMIDSAFAFGKLLFNLNPANFLFL